MGTEVVVTSLNEKCNRGRIVKRHAQAIEIRLHNGMLIQSSPDGIMTVREWLEDRYKKLSDARAEIEAEMASLRDEIAFDSITTNMKVQ